MATDGFERPAAEDAAADGVVAVAGVVPPAPAEVAVELGVVALGVVGAGVAVVVVVVVVAGVVVAGVVVPAVVVAGTVAAPGVVVPPGRARTPFRFWVNALPLLLTPFSEEPDRAVVPEVDEPAAGEESVVAPLDVAAGEADDPEAELPPVVPEDVVPAGGQARARSVASCFFAAVTACSSELNCCRAVVS